MLAEVLYARYCKCPRYSGSSAYLGAGEDRGVTKGTSAGDALSGEGVVGSASSSSEASGEDVGEAFTSSGDDLDGKGASEGVESKTLGRALLSSSCKMDWN